MDDLSVGDTLDGRFMCESCCRFFDGWIYCGWQAEEMPPHAFGRMPPSGAMTLEASCPNCGTLKALDRRRGSPDSLA